MNNPEEPWYAVRCLFVHGRSFDSSDKRSYEERVVLVRADSEDAAIQAAELEAEEYARDVDARYLQFCQSFHLFERKIGSGAEIFSLMRDSALDQDEYIDRFFSTGEERAR